MTATLKLYVGHGVEWDRSTSRVVEVEQNGYSTLIHALADEIHSLYGNEDVQLTDKLLVELPGILHWALDGWQRLHERGRFHVPASSREQADELDRLSSPIGSFVKDCCELGGNHRSTIGDLFFAWNMWCGREGREHPGTKQMFCRDLKTAVPGLKRRRKTGNTGFYDGIRVLPEGG